MKRQRIISSSVFVLVLVLVATGRGRDLAAQPSGSAGTLIRGASLVLTMDRSLGDRSLLGQLRNADVLIVGDRIAAVGHVETPPAGTRVIEGAGLIVMPGFVDTHDHLWQSVIRGCATDANVADWFPRCGSPFASGNDFNERYAYAAVRLSATGLIDTGVTTVVDWSHAFNTDFVRGNLRALNDSGLRYVYAMLSKPGGPDLEAAKAAFIDPNPLGTLHVAGNVAAERLPGAVAIAKRLGVKLHIHLLEDPSQRPHETLKDLDHAGALGLGRDLIAAHVIHVRKAEIRTLAQHGTAVSHQPLSNMRLASGIMPYPEMQDAGIPIGMGLDGATNDTTDAFSNVRAAVGLQRALREDPSASPRIDEVLRAATMGGAEILGLERTIGSLTPGKQADVIVIDTKMLNFGPVLVPVAQLVFNGQPRNVRWVFVAGRALKEDGRLEGVNERELVEAAQEAADDLARRLRP